MAVTVTNLVVNGDGSADVTYSSTTNGGGNQAHWDSLVDFRRDADLIASAMGDNQLLVLLLLNWLRRDPSKTPSNVIGRTITVSPGAVSGNLITVA